MGTQPEHSFDVQVILPRNPPRPRPGRHRDHPGSALHHQCCRGGRRRDLGTAGAASATVMLALIPAAATLLTPVFSTPVTTIAPPVAVAAAFSFSFSSLAPEPRQSTRGASRLGETKPSIRQLCDNSRPLSAGPMTSAGYNAQEFDSRESDVAFAAKPTAAFCARSDTSRWGGGSGSRGIPLRQHGQRWRVRPGRQYPSGVFVLGAGREGNDCANDRGGDVWEKTMDRSTGEDGGGSGSDGGGSVLGASLLFAGTAIGAGMLALPAETAESGFVPTVATLASCWAFTYVTSLVTLEASWSVGRRRHPEHVEGPRKLGEDDAEGGGGAGFLSITKETLGPVGEVVTAVLFWFLLTSIIVAYTSEGGQLVSEAVAELSSSGTGAGSSPPPTLPAVTPSAGSVAFMAFFASLAIFGTERVDAVNRILVLGLVGSFLSLVGVTLPSIDVGLLSRGDWTAVYPAAVSVGILSFGAQNVVPTLLVYLGGDPVRTRRAVFVGSLIPLAMYGLWEAVFLGVVPWDGASTGGGGDKMQVVTALGDVGGTAVRELVEAFSACAIGSSMAGASVSLVDFFQDAIAVVSDSSSSSSTSSAVEESEFKKTTTTIESVLGAASLKGRKRRLLAAAVALGPPLALAEAYPDAFLGALENAGLIGGVSLYGILPALAVLRLRHQGGMPERGQGQRQSPSLWLSSSNSEGMPGRLAGGNPALYGVVALSVALVVPEFVRLGEGLLPRT